MAEGRVLAASLAAQGGARAPLVRQVGHIAATDDQGAVGALKLQLAVARDVVEVCPQVGGVSRPAGDLDHHLGGACSDAFQTRPRAAARGRRRAQNGAGPHHPLPNGRTPDVLEALDHMEIGHSSTAQ